MENRKKKGIRKYIPWVLLALLALLLALMPVLARNAAAGAEATVLQATAQTGEVENTLAGGGTLTAEDAVKVQVPATVEITEFLVANGDHVEAGQPVAKVNPVTVMSAIAEVQENLESIAKQMYGEFNGATHHYIKAKAPGRVKAVYARRDDEASRVVVEHGALAVISLDGLMKVRILTALPIHAGDSLVMRLSDGKEYPGRVETALNGDLSVTMTDNGPPLGGTVTAYTHDGDVVGSGTLEVHSPWSVLATDGTVFEVDIHENQEITAGWTLFGLTDMTGSAEYRSLAAQHREYEELLQDLFALYTDDTVAAPETGFVSGIDRDIIKNTAAMDSKPVLKLLANETDGEENEGSEDTSGDGSGTSNNEEDIPIFTTTIMVTGVNGQYVSGFTFSEGDDLKSIQTLIKLMTKNNVPFTTSGATFWELKDMIPVPSSYALEVGDVIMINRTTPPIAVLKVGHQDIADEIDKAMSMMNGGGMPDLSGYGGLVLSTETTEEDDGLYDLEKTTIMQVTPDKVMTISIDVDELDVLQYERGMKADVIVDALPDRSFTAEVEEIAAVGENSGGNSKYTVKLRLDRAPDMLDGMNASVIVHRGSATALLLPVEAVHDRGSHSYVYTALDNKTGKPTVELEVQTGVSDGQQVAITEGLTEGQAVFYEYYLPVESSPAGPAAGMPGAPNGFGRP